MSFESLRSFLTTKGLEVPKYAHARYKGTAIFKVGLFSKFSKNYKDGDWKEIKPIEMQIDLKIF